jgi:hypothetical protein
VGSNPAERRFPVLWVKGGRGCSGVWPKDPMRPPSDSCTLWHKCQWPDAHCCKAGHFNPHQSFWECLAYFLPISLASTEETEQRDSWTREPFCPSPHSKLCLALNLPLHLSSHKRTSALQIWEQGQVERRGQSHCINSSRYLVSLSPGAVGFGSFIYPRNLNFIRMYGLILWNWMRQILFIINCY